MASGTTERHATGAPPPTTGAQRWVWHSRYGAMVIEVVGQDIFVNAQRVELHEPGGAPAEAQRAALG